MKVSLKGIGKRYGSQWIFKEVDAEFSPLNTYGIIGPNGSGKSTLLQIISGFVTPTAGEILFDNGETDISEVYKHCAICAPYLDLPTEFTVKETIEIQGGFKPFNENWNTDSILALTELNEHDNKTLDQLSSGMRQRLKLALAICSDASLLLLDEPCANLDATWANWFNETLVKTSNGRLVIICSNNQAEELKTVSTPIFDLNANNA